MIKAAGILLAAFFALQQPLCAQQQISISHAKGETKVNKAPKRAVIFDLGSLETYHELGLQCSGLASVDRKITDIGKQLYGLSF